MDTEQPPLVKKKIKPLYIVLAVIIALPILYFGTRQVVSANCNSEALRYVRERVAKYPRITQSEYALGYEMTYTLCMRDKGFNP